MHIKDTNSGTVITTSPQDMPKRSWRTFLIGQPLPTADAPHQAIGKLIGLAVFASDALSSTAYATQELLVTLLLAGVSAFYYSIPISFAIVILLAILIISYEQVIYAYPNGGGAYVVARENLGETWALIAGASLLTDYILTVSVSISSGVAQLISAFPALLPFRVSIAVVLVFMVLLLNLRGVKESGKVIAIPSYFFIIIMLALVLTGLTRYLTGSLHPVIDPPEINLVSVAQPVTFFLLLRAFSNGTSAVTGVEAISNGVTAFKEPRSKNAGITLIWMAFILGSFLIGITFLAYQIKAIPSETETVISQLARTIFDTRGFLYFLVMSGTTVILIMAANTAFAGFPRLGALIAQDGFLPRQMAYKGDRLVYSNGMIALAVVAALLIIVINANVTNLIPLYAIGVFLSFTISQVGMAIRWRTVGKIPPGAEIKHGDGTLKYEKNWSVKFFINSFGAVTTAIVVVVFSISKFADGAWIVMVLIPLMVGAFMAIHQHYETVRNQLSLKGYGSMPEVVRHRVVLLVSGVHRGTLEGLRYARTLSNDVTAVHVSINDQETEKIVKRWEEWGDGTRLVIVESPYRLFLDPVLEYISRLEDQLGADEVITVVVPQFIPVRKWSRFLHSRTADTLRKALLNRDKIVVTELSYQVK
ncbi:MAG: APC family permease [Chloroflexi bacterium]|nr:APC family permease [Chloroflexota bacterium]